MCSNVTCPPGRNMYYGAKVSGSLDRDSGWVKKFVNTSDYTSGEFECKDASFDNFDPIADQTKACWCSNEKYHEDKVYIADYEN